MPVKSKRKLEKIEQKIISSKVYYKPIESYESSKEKKHISASDSSFSQKIVLDESFDSPEGGDNLKKETYPNLIKIKKCSEEKYLQLSIYSIRDMIWELK